MRQATTNFQLNVDNIPVVVSNNCLKKKNNKEIKERKKQQKIQELMVLFYGAD